MIKKKILIVEDTSENMNAAKTFFSTVSDFEFVYTDNRKDAQLLLTEKETFLIDIIALITDKSIPYLPKETLEDYRLYNPGLYNLYTDESALKEIQKSNGCALMAIAHSKGIPAIMVSEHGSASAQMLNCNNFSHEAKVIGKILPQLNPYSWESYEISSSLDTKEMVKQILTSTYGKVDTRTWQRFWDYFQTQILD